MIFGKSWFTSEFLITKFMFINNALENYVDEGIRLMSSNCFGVFGRDSPAKFYCNKLPYGSFYVILVI
jgi:hypothetical protein